MNWKQGRDKAIAMGVELCERGYDAHYVVDTVLRVHYVGRSPAHAKGRMLRDIELGVLKLRDAERAAAWKDLQAMASDLEAEGWRWVQSATQGRAGFWRHITGDVNLNGGAFETYEEATRETYQSATRAWIGGK